MRVWFHLAIGAAITLSAPAAALAQDAPEEGDEEPNNMVDRLAQQMADAFAPRWEGPRVEWPVPAPRPVSRGVYGSWLYPVNVHLSVRSDDRMAAGALAALEEAHDYLARTGWSVPVSDGGAGGTEGFDLYLSPVAPFDREPTDVTDARPEDDDPPLRRYAGVSYDAPVGWGGLDRVTTFAVVDPDAGDPAILRPCVISTYVQAALLSSDPAEAEAWRVATGDYVAWLLTGHFGCSDEPLVRHQHDSWQSWVSRDPESGHGGALFLAMLSARTDGLSGRFIRDLWSGAQQLTWEGEQLRAAPDMWQVIRVVMDVGADPLPRLVEEFAVARYFIGPPSRSAGAPLHFLASLPEDAEVPVLGRVSWDQLPRRFEPRELEVEPYGSAYVVVDTTDAPPASRVRIWLRGELGVGWSLIAVRLDADGFERGRVRAPVRLYDPRSYIPLELTDPETASVVIVVTNMGLRLPDADEPDDQVRSFRMILDRATDDPTPSPE
ncbi:MAG: hypothetical protein AB7S26_31945 [Sandaracinaceae bacterium]